MHACVLSCFNCDQLFATLWTVAHQTPLSMGFSRQEYWNRLPFPSPGNLPHSGIEPGSPALLGPHGDYQNQVILNDLEVKQPQRSV